MKLRFESDGFPIKRKKRYLYAAGCVCISSINFLSISFNADLVLSNKLVVYDLENQGIGWVEYNCKYFEPFHYFHLLFGFMIGSLLFFLKAIFDPLELCMIEYR